MKLFFLAKFKNSFTAASATKKETIKPTASKSIWSNENVVAEFIRSNPVAASNVGTARRKENWTIVSLFSLTDKPPIIVAAALETPGIIENAWKIPMRKHFLYEISEIVLSVFPFLLYKNSNKIMKTPPKRRDHRTICSFPRSDCLNVL